MSRHVLGLALVLIFLVRASSAVEIPLNGQTFTLPDGFTIESVAGPPLVNRPVTAAFDEQGRLYVSDSSGSNAKVQQQLAERPHRVLRLEDADGDGRFDRQTVFADRMMFPEGTLWLDGSLYVSAPPTIWKLTDTDGDGKADRREEWLTKTLTNCANDLHGPYRGPDGWIYWCKGAFQKQTYERPGKPPFVTRAAHIFRAPDHHIIEPVMTGGMDNPVDVTFTPGGERIFSTTFLTNPHDGLRDGLIHAIYGGVYGKDHDVFEGHKRTGDLMPPLVHLGPAACCGLLRYESTSFGPGYADNLFTCCFNMHKLTRHVLQPSGATFTAKTDDFLVSNSLDFHPTDVVEDADGSLLVLDTGGWYKLCCPTSQLWKPDILGGIYRIRRRGAPAIDDPRGLKLDWAHASPDALAERLGDARPAVRRRAMDTLAKRGAVAIPALKEIQARGSIQARRNSVWTLTRIDSEDAAAATRAALADPDETVRQAALHSISLWRNKQAVPLLIEMLHAGVPHNQRAAAEALGRIGDHRGVSALLAAAGRAPFATDQDRILEHSLIFALIEIDDPHGTRAGLASPHIGTRRAALIALDQMDGGGLAPETVIPWLSSSDAEQKRVAAWILSHHKEWGDALAGWLESQLSRTDRTAHDQAELERQLSLFAGNPRVRALIGRALQRHDLPPANRRVVLRSMRNAGLKEQDAVAWVDPLRELLAGKDAEFVPEAVATLRTLNFERTRGKSLIPLLLALGANAGTDDMTRLNALAAIPGGLWNVSEPVFAFLVNHLDAERPGAERATAAGTLSTSHLSNTQLVRLTSAFQTVGPLEADRLLQAFEGCRDEGVGRALVAALGKSPVLTSLQVPAVARRLENQPPAVRSQAETLYRRINVDLAHQRQRIDELLPLVSKGDVRRGQLVFARSKAACITCHEFGYVGGHIGPDLTNIGRIRSERDLLEAILFPSASFVRSFEPIQIVTRSGRAFNGLLRKDAADEVVLVASATETIRVPRDEIEEMKPSRVSIMPAGLDQQLTPHELADLVAFLKNAK